jgi:hypothetical protein
MRDIDIRQKLRDDERLHSGEPDTRVVEELGLCKGIARVDIAVVNGSIHGYEIKSERDTLARLPGQIDIYNRALDFVTIVTSPTHVEKIDKLVPSWWGIWIAIEDDKEFGLEITREPCPNPNIIPFAIAQLLWRDEALQALADWGLATGLRSKPREELWRRLASEVPLKDLGNIVRGYLKRRRPDWLPARLPS